MGSALCSSAGALERRRDCLPHSCCCLAKHGETGEEGTRRRRQEALDYLGRLVVGEAIGRCTVAELGWWKRRRRGWAHEGTSHFVDLTARPAQQAPKEFI